MLEIKDLAVSYGGSIHALRNVSLQVPEGGVVALLGSNGAGKTTLLRAVSRTLRRQRGGITAGEITFGGRDLARCSAADVVRLGLVQVPEGRRIFGRLTVEENLRVAGLARRDKAGLASARAHVYDMFPVLAERRRQRASLMSGGEQQMLAIGRALMAGPRLLMLDEPSLGLAPRVVERIGEVIGEINRQGTAVLLIEQNAAMALEVAQHAHVLELGRVSLSGPADQLAATDEVRHLYLGHTGATNLLDEPTDALAAVPSLSRWAR